MKKTISAMIFAGLMVVGMQGCDGDSDTDLVSSVCNKLGSCDFMDASQVSECKKNGNAQVGAMSSAEKDAVRKCLTMACSEFVTCLDDTGDTVDGSSGSSGSSGGSGGSGGSSGGSIATFVNNVCDKMLSCGYMTASELSSCKTEGNDAMSSATSAQIAAYNTCVSKSCSEFVTCIGALD